MDLNDSELQLRDHRYHYFDEPRFAVLDVETTGLCTDTNSIVEIAIIELQSNGSIVSEWSSLVDAPGEGDLGASNIHGITRQMLAGAPRFETLVDEIADRLRGRIVVGHYVSFDLAHLSSECSRINYPLPNVSLGSICTRDLAHRFLPPGPRTLQNCCEAVGITVSDAHSARGDTRATAELFKHFIDRINWTTRQQLIHNVESMAWPLRFAMTHGASTAMPRQGAVA